MDDVVGVVTDLFFQSRISAAAKAQDLNVQFLISNAVDQPSIGYLVLIDLDARLDVYQAIRDVKRLTGCRVIAFGPHLDADRLKAAKAAGADRVLAKSKFVNELPNLMAAVRKTKDENGRHRTES